MKILGIDTSTEICALGLMVEGEVLAEINLKLDRRHSERLMPNLVHLFQESGMEIKEIEGIAVTIGPGSFTGLRIGLSTVKAMAQYLQVPVRGVSTLEVLAQGCTGCQGWLVPVLDARRQRVYTALFDGVSFPRRIWKDQALPVSELIGQLEGLEDSRTIYVTGNGIASYGEMFVESGLDVVFLPPARRKPRGVLVAELGASYLEEGAATPLVELLPNYLKKPQARINWQQKYK